MKQFFFLTFLIFSFNVSSFAQVDSVNRKHFIKVNISLGCNLIKAQNFNYKYIAPSYIRDGINKDYQITIYRTLSPNISFAYSRLLNKSKKYFMYLDWENSIYLNTEKFKSNGSQEDNFGKSQVEFTTSNYYYGYNSGLNFTVLKKLNSTQIGFFMGVGIGSLVYSKTYLKGVNYTYNTKLDGVGDEIHFENAQFNITYGIDYRYKIGRHNFSSRFYMNPQIFSRQLISYKFFEFKNKNYLTFFSTAIII